MRDERYNEALRHLEELEKQPLLYPKVYVLKGICVFLTDSEDNYDYEDVTRLYKEALQIDSEYVNALLELGHHYFSAENQSRLAVPLFEKAIKILTDQFTDAIVGLAKCIEDLESSNEAIHCINNMMEKFKDNNKISDLIEELKEQ